jgi:hypothetical protein
MSTVQYITFTNALLPPFCFNCHSTTQILFPTSLTLFPPIYISLFLIAPYFFHFYLILKHGIAIDKDK